MHFKVQGQERQQADFIMADSGVNISAENFAEFPVENSVESKRKNSTDSTRLKSVKSASMSVIKKGIKMGTTGFQQASTQMKKKSATGLSQK